MCVWKDGSEGLRGWGSWTSCWWSGKALHLRSSPRTKENDRPDIHSAKEHFNESRKTFRKDHLRPINPTP